MLLGGDEFRRTQRGNNNAWCQDNETSWYDWTYLERHRDIFRFTSSMIAFRRAHPVLSREAFYTDEEIHWFAPDGGLPNWADPKCRTFACRIDEGGQNGLYLMFNADSAEIDFHPPRLLAGCGWYLAADTSLPAEQGLPTAGEETLCDDSAPYKVVAHSSAILLARTRNPDARGHSAADKHRGQK
jgi:glycogen operon protein